jgi:hypothetical protein
LIAVSNSVLIELTLSLTALETAINKVK